MFDHVGLKVRDLETSVRFYTDTLKSLGHVLCYSDETVAGFGPKGAPGLWLHLKRDAAGPGTHVAFSAADRASVDRFHNDGLKAGGRDNGAPGLRPDYSPTYYAAFLYDPDGNNIEAVCHKA